MTQFTFSELKPRIEEAIRQRYCAIVDGHNYGLYPHQINMHPASPICNGCRMFVAMHHGYYPLTWNNEPIELVDGFDCGYSVYFDFANSKWTKINIVAIGQHTGQVYTWLLGALLPELWEENHD